MLKLIVERTVLKLLWLFPVNRKKVFFSSYEGGPITCNPKYIFLALDKKHGDKIKYVWECNKTPSDIPTKTHITFVKHNTLTYIYHVMTSKVIITNSGISASFPLRKRQLSVNTWHGAGCYKKVGKDLSETNNDEYKKHRFYAEKNTSFYLSGCEAWTKVFSAAVYSDSQKFLQTGSPRIDYLLNNNTKEEKERIKRKIGINEKIVLYAPTYRGIRDTPDEAVCPIDVERVLSVLEYKFGGRWIFAYRCHYATASMFRKIDRTVDLSSYDDVQELLLVADVLISDYSSSIWDYSFTYKPCFLFCYDLNKYTEERDFYMPIKNWHFPISLEMDELVSDIKEFDNKQHRKNMELHHMELGSYEFGNATASVERLIEKWV